MVDLYSKATVEQLVSEKSSGDGEMNESAASPEPERKQDETLSQKEPPLQQCCDDGYSNTIAGTPEQR
jgi:hypothetical protein